MPHHPRPRRSAHWVKVKNPGAGGHARGGGVCKRSMRFEPRGRDPQATVADHGEATGYPHRFAGSLLVPEYARVPRPSRGCLVCPPHLRRGLAIAQGGPFGFAAATLNLESAQTVIALLLVLQLAQAPCLPQ